MIEIADTTLNYDKQIKAPLYARFFIPEYWLIDIQKLNITIYQKPVQGQYTIAKTQALPIEIAPLLLPSINLKLR